MKIGIYCTSNHVYPVPSNIIYANITVAGMVADGLSDLGEDVTFFAPVGTKTRAKLQSFDMLPYDNPSVLDKYPGERTSYFYEDLMMLRTIKFLEENRFDVFHTHCRPSSIMNYAPLCKLPVISTLHDPLSFPAATLLPNYTSFGNWHLVSLSMAQRKPMPDLNWAGNVYNGIDLSEWEYSETHGDYLLFVGRVMEEKGVDIAVQVALKTGKKLKIAGTVYPKDQDFFDRTIKPHLGDQIEYLGMVSHPDLKPIYKNALAFINPIRWEEPFGLVVVESLASGTPVVASNKGAMGEIIENGKSGYLADSTEELVARVGEISAITRKNCRLRAEEKFSSGIMAKSYQQVYRDLATTSH